MNLPMNNDKKSQLEAVLFDLDGTLLDTANDLGEALNYVLKKHGLATVARELYRPVASDGAKGLLELGFGDTLGNFDYEQLRVEFLEYYQNNIAVHTCFYPGIKTLITTLNSNNIPWGVVTNKPEYLTLILLPYFNEFKQCQSIIGGDTLSKRKPDPEPLLFACKQMSVDAKHCIYVGDAQRDIEAGNRAQMTTIIAQWGYILDKQSTNHWQADFSSDSANDLIKFIL